MLCKPPPLAQSQLPWHGQTWVRWLAIWLVGIGIGLPLMVILAAIGSGNALNVLVRTATITISGSTISSYIVADALTTLLIALIPGTTSGAVIGFLQWKLFSHRLRPARLWIFASACGGALAWWTATALLMPIQHLAIVFLRGTVMLDIGMVDSLIAALVAGSTVGSLGGAIAGSIQWLILRRASSWTIGWIIVSALGWGSVWALGAVVLAIFALRSPIIVS